MCHLLENNNKALTSALQKIKIQEQRTFLIWELFLQDFPDLCLKPSLSPKDYYFKLTISRRCRQLKEKPYGTSGGECDLPTAGFQTPELIYPSFKRISRPDAAMDSQP